MNILLIQLYDRREELESNKYKEASLHALTGVINSADSGAISNFGVDVSFDVDSRHIDALSTLLK